MPRLSHKKTRTGCQRCKARKVKCDEVKPRCSACARHDVPCEYVRASSGRSEATTPPGPPQGPFLGGIAGSHGELDANLDARMEIRLMHEWTAYTCQTFSAGWHFWKYQVPLIAMEFRFALDAMFALAALNASRQPPSQWIPLEGRMIPIRDPLYEPSDPHRGIGNHWQHIKEDINIANPVSDSDSTVFHSMKRSHEMLKTSRQYFDRAIDGHRRGLDSLSSHNVEAVYITSLLVSLHALFTLSEDEEDTTLPTIDPVLWIRLADGTRILCDNWRKFVGDDWIRHAGVFYGIRDLAEEDALFKVERGAPFEKLLTWAEEFETMTPADKICYEETLGYISLTYRGIIRETDHPLVTCRRLVALPSRVSKRFLELIEIKSARALTMLAHAFALMKLIADKVPWFKGIAERQVPRILQQLPMGWKEMMKWPLMIANDEHEPSNNDDDIRDILSL